jgi:hypothetical protein
MWAQGASGGNGPDEIPSTINVLLALIADIASEATEILITKEI